MNKIHTRLALAVLSMVVVLGLAGPQVAHSAGSTPGITSFSSIPIPSLGSLATAGPVPAPGLQYGPSTFVNFETPHVHPLDMTPDEQTLVAVNTAEGSLLIFSLGSGQPTLKSMVMVGSDPVSVRARSATEVWVVNRVSGSISVVDVRFPAVTGTFDVCRSPGDVVFPSNGQAIVSCTRPNQLVALNATTHAVVSSTAIVGESPRSLALSADGGTVYAGIFESGTPTTVLEGDSNDPRINNVTQNPLGPWGGETPVPNNPSYLNGTSTSPSTSPFIPALNPVSGPPPPVATIVEKSGDGYFSGSVSCSQTVFGDPDAGAAKSCQYEDPNSLTWITCAADGGTCTLPAGGGRFQVRYGANGFYSNGGWWDDMRGDWTSIVTGVQSTLSNRVAGWDLPDHDVAIYNVASGAVKYQTRLMNAVMSVAVNPGNSQVYVVGTDATNNIRFQPNLTGKFLHVDLGYFAVSSGNSNFAPSIVDLNPQIDYTQSSTTAANVALAIGDPRGIAWTQNGQYAFVTGMGSNNLIKINANGARVALGSVGQGPTGVIVDNQRGQVYVLNKFDASISTVRSSDLSSVATTAFFDPTPTAITAGRPFLYNTHLGSGNGQIACGSCHIDAKSDRLTWDLGDPSAAPDQRDGFVYHPMKGPMATMTLQNIIGSPSLHHRGDRADLFAFAPAFQQLQGTAEPLDAASMTLFQSFLATVTFPPNPNRDANNAFGQAVSIPGPLNTVRGFGNANNQAGNSFCGISCHQGARGRSDTHLPNVLHLSQPMDPTSLQGLYERLSLWWNSPNGSTAGTGVLENGTEDSVFANQGVTDDMIAYMVSFEGPIDGRPEVSGSVHAGVGLEAYLTSTGLMTESPPACAPENGTCKFSGTREVIFGANGSYYSGVFTGSASCNDATFGDPDYGVVKSCALRGAALTLCSSQGQTCAVNGLSEVFYATGTSASQTIVTRVNTPCTSASFGAPASTVGTCYIRPAREWARVRYLLQLAQSGEVGLVYQAYVLKAPRGGYYVGDGMFQTDNIATQATLQNLYNWVVMGGPVELMIVPRGTEYRIGVDANLNGHLNGDELASGVNPRAESAGTWTQCAPTNGVCNLVGTHVVRFGVGTSWAYRVVTGGFTCSAAAFGDPSPGATEECDVAN